MVSERRSLISDELCEVLKRLDEVMAEAERLRREATRRLSQQRSAQQPMSMAADTRRRTRATRKAR